MAKNKIPKQIAGVRVPKSVRKGAVGKFLKSKAGRAVVAEAVMALGAVVVAKRARDGGFEGLGARVGDAGKRAGERTGDAIVTLSYAVGEGVRAFSRALQGGVPDAPAPATPATAEERDTPKKDLRSLSPAAH